MEGGKMASLKPKAKRPKTHKQVLTIAGSDSGGGAGIQADIKAMQANGVFAMSVIASITAQNTKSVTMVYDLPLKIIAAQIDAVFDDFEVSAVKTGMLSTVEIVELVSDKLKEHRGKNLVVDPVMVSKSGFDLLRPDAMEKVKKVLIPLARLVTPNIYEAEKLSNIKVRTVAEAKIAAKVIHDLGCKSVLIKGGHLLEARGCDVLFDGRGYTLLHGEYIETPNTHGTGCTYAAAIAANMAKGLDLEGSIRSAKAYLTEAIRNALSIGHGHGPTHHFYFLQETR